VPEEVSTFQRTQKHLSEKEWKAYTLREKSKLGIGIFFNVTCSFINISHYVITYNVLEQLFQRTDFKEARNESCL
jgi:hypothetical protein